ncbi:hypothetical protein VXN63_05895 [Marinilactibacillus sp. XAAS-LB27]|uniref:hypothetical protein n=1 Tax=Marinilactibacillus sp. XAAS-LB27 TaxID=3114538 RepID=UPI002E171A4E|nr:hypothetical protein [Marinilactibacillus sp. XAAS-LB27]
MKKFLTLTASAIILLGLLWSGRYYFQMSTSNSSELFVATDGSDENPGTIGEPLRTLEAAADQAVPGTTVSIRGGIYFESLIVQHDGTASDPIVFQAYSDEKVHLSGEQFEDTPDDRALVEIDGYDHISIKGLTLKNLSTGLPDKTVIGMLVTGHSQYIELTNNWIENIGTTALEGNAHGIAVYGNVPIQEITIHKNTLTNLKLGLSEALVVNGNVSDFSIKENHIYETDNIAIDAIGYEGVADNGNEDYARNGVISENTVHNNSSYHNPSYENDYSAGGIYIDGGQDITIENNTVYQNDIGIEATSEHKDRSANQIKILNNNVYENTYAGISIGGYDADRGGTTHSLISGNTLTDNDTIGLEGGQILFQYYSDSNIIESNDLTASPSGLFISHEYTGNTDTIFEDNHYRLGHNTRPRWLWNNREVYSLEDFQKLTNSQNESFVP